MKIKFILSTVLLILILVSLNLFFNSKDSKLLAKNILDKADIQINGNRPWDITVHNEDLYACVLNEGSVGLGESYMKGWWDCDALDQFFFKILNADLDKQISQNWSMLFDLVCAKIFNFQSKDRAFEVGEKHYDIGNNLYENMLDDRMIYSCGYWKNAKNIDEAQENKLDLICKKLNLKPGMKLLDIGCGWGGLACYAAEKYGVQVVGITISKEQLKYAQDNCRNLHDKLLKVDFRLQDYRDLNEKFDRIVSVGMFEHVGYKNYKEFMQVVNRCLKDDGLFLLHTIGGNFSNSSGDAWINKYIFPNGMLPSVNQISAASEGLFVMEDWHNFGSDYDKTLMSWFDKFDNNWNKIKQNYNDQFYRMWKYYLLSCAGLFRARNAQLWQIVFSKNGQIGGYNSVR